MDPNRIHNWTSRTLFRGENLDYLQAMNSSSVDLIATDPPFNKGIDFHSNPDSLMKDASFQDRWRWKEDVHPEWTKLIRDQHPNIWSVIHAAAECHSESMAAFLCFMAVRILEMHRVLRPTGSIYLHCDQTANSYIRLIMDAIFGHGSFQGDITWNKGYRGTPRKANYQQEHDTILYYVKHPKKYYWNTIYGEYKDKKMSRYNKVDEDGNRYALIKRKRTSGEVYYGKCYPKGKLQGDVINIPLLASTDKERTDYPTQKPIALYEMLIKASCPEGGMVLDPFAGCATTCVAAERLGRRWVGIDLWPKVGKVVMDQLIRNCSVDGIPFDEEVYLIDKLPTRTDGGSVSAPKLKTPRSKIKPKKMSRDDAWKWLIEEEGPICKGCDRPYDWDPRHLQVDHKLPKADDGPDALYNFTLLCAPCNRLKGKYLSLSGLRRENKRLGYMYEE